MKKRASNGTTNIYAKSRTWRYQTWQVLRSRAKRTGLPMHPDWVDDMEVFWSAVGERPTLDHWLEQRVKGLGYVPGNVEWQLRWERTKRMTNDDRAY